MPGINAQTFANLGNLMQQQPQPQVQVGPWPVDPETESDSEDELEAVRAHVRRFPATQAGGQKGGVLGMAAAVLAINPNFYDQMYQFLESIGLQSYTNKVGELAAQMLTAGMFKYENDRIVPTAVGKKTIQSFVEHMLGRRGSVALERFITTRLAALFNFVVRDGTGRVLYPARLQGDE